MERSARVGSVLNPGPDRSARVGGVIKGRWRLDAFLGVGGTGAVYAATHRNGNRVAIKVLHDRHSTDESLGRRLEQEACAANSIGHPGAVRIFDDGRTEDGAIFLVMELLEGEGLHTRLARNAGQIPVSDAMSITYGILDVLAAAHARGIVHGDIKPENVFITRQGEVKVLDFGIAGIFAASPRTRRSNEVDLFGTPGYMAPEQALGRADEIDPRTDLWAVAATLHRMLTGRLVHESPSLMEQLVDAGTRPAPPFAKVMPQADPPLAALMDRGLAFATSDRFPDARQMQEAVRRCSPGSHWGTTLSASGLALQLAPPSSGIPLTPIPPNTAPPLALGPGSTTPSLTLGPGSTAPSLTLSPWSTAPSLALVPGSTAPSLALGPPSTGSTLALGPGSTAGSLTEPGTPKSPGTEPTVQSKRIGSSRRSFLVIAGGTAMAVASLIRFGKSKPHQSSDPASHAASPAPLDTTQFLPPTTESRPAGEPAGAEANTEPPQLLGSDPLQPSPRAGDQPKRLRRRRPPSRLTADDDIWSRRH